MSFYQLNRPLIMALRDRLDDELPAKIAEINAFYGDSIELDEPHLVLAYVPPVELLTGFPTLGIQVLPSTFEDDIGSSATGVHGLAVIIFQAAADSGLLSERLLRYQQAVATIALETRALGDAWGVTLRGLTPGPTLDVEEHPRTWVSWAGVAIQARRSE